MNDPPIPSFYSHDNVVSVRRVEYQAIAAAAREYCNEHNLSPASVDTKRIGLLAIDCQLTFCNPEFELYVAGRSGTGAVDDTRRLVEFIYRNLNRITAIHATLDTHTAEQIFFDSFFVDAHGNHPTALVSTVDRDSLLSGEWMVNPAVAASLGFSVEQLQQHVIHYVSELAAAGKYSLTIWPYHAMQGSIGHALVPALEEACFFHALARGSQTSFETKGGNPLTENYSVLRPEVLTTSDGSSIASKNTDLIKKLLSYDRLIIAGQATSHCVAWTIDDLLSEITLRDSALAKRVYLLTDCTSPVVVPGIVDYTDAADAAYHRFRDAGMHIVRSDSLLESWPSFS